MSKIVEVKNLTKVYQLYNRPIDRLKEGISLTRKNYHRDFYALNDISFDVEKGESFGIIGVNGSGKSTLLKILTGVLSKTSGDVKVDGKVAALLELGAGFNLDYTGIENIYLNGTMMGFSKEEMDEKLDKIIEFADLKDDAINRPVKEYSSGMFVRLAFSLSIAVEPEILIVDEALSVGDIFFQTKCYKRMDELKSKGTTIIMVTHDLGAVIKYCDRTMVLHNGNQVAIGAPHEMVDLYKKILAGQEPTISDSVGANDNSVGDAANSVGDDTLLSHVGANDNSVGASSTSPLKESMSINPHADIYGDMKAEFIDFGILDQKGNPATVIVKGETFTIKEKIRMNEDIKDPIFTWTIKDKRGTDLTGTNTMLEKVDTGFGAKGRVYDVSFTQKMRLQGGEYLLSMSCTSFEGDELKVHHRMYDVISLTVLINENKVGIFDSESKVDIH
ncbi:MAG: ABC transporter ATP-binding protein [Lachnospiraceae bacterium]|nr:ABC transporter ATP-binding protein [Lachnospiraceae bacterium]